MPDSKWSLIKWYLRLQQLHGGARDPRSPMFLDKDKARPLLYRVARQCFIDLRGRGRARWAARLAGRGLQPDEGGVSAVRVLLNWDVGKNNLVPTVTASFDVLEAGDMVEGCSIGFWFGFCGFEPVRSTFCALAGFLDLRLRRRF